MESAKWKVRSGKYKVPIVKLKVESEMYCVRQNESNQWKVNGRK